MINYTEKGIGLHERIAAAGHRLEQVDNAWAADDEAAVQAIIDAYPLSATQDEVCQRIEDYAAALRGKFVAGISPAEMSSWSIKRAEAQAYAATGEASAAPVLSIEAAARQVTLGALADRVLGNSEALGQLEAVIAGVGGRHRDAVRELDTFEAVLAYDWRSGWPE